MITQSQLKEQLNYNPKTGLFTRLTNQRNMVRVIGDKAGSVGAYGYLRIKVNGKTYGAHQLAILYVSGVMPSHQVDHVNGIRTDNRITNLRLANHTQNARNSGLYSNNKSGFHGVYWLSAIKKWRVRIGASSKSISVGYYFNLSDAVKARLDAEESLGYHINHGR